MEERLNNLLELFLNDGDPVGYVTGREIIEKELLLIIKISLLDEKIINIINNLYISIK